MERPTAQAFEALLGETFATAGDEITVDLKLVKVDVKTGERPDNAFSVEFEGPPETFLEQRIYRLEHHDGTVLDVFLVPVAGDDSGYTYEAVFTRLDA